MERRKAASSLERSIRLPLAAEGGGALRARPRGCARRRRAARQRASGAVSDGRLRTGGHAAREQTAGRVSDLAGWQRRRGARERERGRSCARGLTARLLEHVDVRWGVFCFL